jgi:hypothetical protein
MFDLPSPSEEDSGLPIPTFVSAADLYTFLRVVEDQVNCKVLLDRWYDDTKVRIPASIHNITGRNKFILEELADRFDCEKIALNVKHSIHDTYANFSGFNILYRASQANSIPMAKMGIIKLESAIENYDKSLYSKWWSMMEGIRPSWQIEITKLVWKNQHELVNRPGQPRQVLASGRYAARKRETIMVQATSSWKEIAAAFNPKSEVSRMTPS